MICKIINSSGTIVESGDLHKLRSTARPSDSTCNPVQDSAQNEAQHDWSHLDRRAPWTRLHKVAVPGLRPTLLMSQASTFMEIISTSSPVEAFNRTFMAINPSSSKVPKDKCRIGFSQHIPELGPPASRGACWQWHDFTCSRTAQVTRE
ncbi:hypothetical protein PISMIDRAFT_527711 [Pisolithus microcarpus 441]|uniref:Uncharacterized protein n=1 Tax=Pisolithus microcarpus 441 TaxID=765257 RepID=A0A0C9YZ13_9AGAM|nr:hypothetical protein PISMIDRAFT_527711 [Pisolithus microcarpus 441]